MVRSIDDEIALGYDSKDDAAAEGKKLFTMTQAEQTAYMKKKYPGYKAPEDYTFEERAERHAGGTTEAIEKGWITFSPATK
jgi:hypothetical protein